MRSISGFFSRNLTLKLSAFGVALLLWVAVRAEAPSREDFPDVPVQIDVIDPRWAVVGEPDPATVTVRFGGPSRALIGMALARPSVVIPLEAVASADTTVRLINSWVRIQDRNGVIVEGIQPSAVRVTLEPVESVSLPPAPRLDGELPEEFAMAASPTVDPPTIRVTGPRSRVSEIDSVPLLPLRLDEVRGSGRFDVALDTAAISGLTTNVSTVALDVRVEDRIERVVSGIPIVLPEALAGTTGLELRPETASVIVRGARSVIDRADPTRFRLVVRIEAADLPPPGGEAEFPIALEGLPPLVQGEPQQLVVTVRNVSSESRQ